MIRRSFHILLACAWLAAPARAADAATLAGMMDAADSAAGPKSPCLMVPDTTVVPVTRPTGRCAAETVARLYLGLLRDRDRLRVIGDGATYFQQWLELLQPRLERNAQAAAQSLLAEIDRKRLQRLAAGLARDIQHAETFFAEVMQIDSGAFDYPRIAEDALPEDEADALAALAAQPDIADDERAAAEAALRLAWIEHESAQQEIVLREAQRDVARQALPWLERQFEVAQVTFGDVRRAAADLTRAEEDLVRTRARALALKVRILDLLGRRAAVE